MNWIGFYSMIRREFNRIVRMWTQTLVPPLITALLYILIFGYTLGNRIDNIAGFSYLEFVIPGLVMMGIISSSYANTSSSLYLSKFQGAIQELLISPLSYMEIVLAYTFGGVMRGLMVGFGTLLISLLFTKVTVTHIFVVLFFTIAVSLIFSFAGIITGLWANNFDQMMIFSTFLITPLVFLGGVFYSITMLPGIWQTISHYNPILHMVNGLRYGTLGIVDVPIVTSIIVVSLLTIVTFIITVYLFKKGYNLRD